jgi:uncharacterized protein DUF2399
MYISTYNYVYAMYRGKDICTICVFIVGNMSTSIIITRETRDELKKMGLKGQTYDLVISELIRLIASARAVMYYAGRSQRVHLDMVKELAKNGTDIIFVEKEGIVDVLTSYADEYGIALVNTQGRLTEYGKDLIEAAKKAGANVAILTDYDALGIQIAEGSRIQIPRIGIDRDTIGYFQQHGYEQLSENDVEEEYKPNSNAIDPVVLLANSDAQRYRYIQASSQILNTDYNNRQILRIANRNDYTDSSSYFLSLI